MAANAEPGTKRRRLVHLQILRGVAASLVVVNHTFTTLDFLKLPQPVFAAAADANGRLGVAAFFVLSGFLMVRQTPDFFGSALNAFVFAWRRVVRVVPLYWFATLLLLAFEHHWGWPVPHAGGQLLLSLLFLPNYFSGLYLQPIVAQGWTLNYEMAFYEVFAVCLLLPRRLGLAAIMLVLTSAGVVGIVHWFPPDSLGDSFLEFYFARVLLLFLAGMLLALVAERLPRMCLPSLPVSPALLLAAVGLALLVFPGSLGQWAGDGLLWSAAIVTVALCVFVGERPAGWLQKGLMLLGDASYSTYLFHNWVIYRVVHRISSEPWGAPSRPLALVLDCVGSIVAANVLGLLVHVVFEKPLLHGLRQMPLGAAKGWLRRRLERPEAKASFV